MNSKLLLGIAIGLAALTIVVSSTLAATFDLVAIHPEVAQQTTVYGDHIATLKPFKGKLYAGYGDYGANTGPIAVRAFDPSAGAFTDPMLTSQTEAIYIYRELGGKLYAPNIDTRGGGSGYAVGTAGNPDTWQDVITVDGVHMFDMNTFNGTDLFQGGTAGNGDGIVYRSTDGGATWTESLRMLAGQNLDKNPNNVDVRIHGLGLYQGKLSADMEQVVLSGSSIYYATGKNALPSMVFDGTSWTTGPMLTSSGYMSHPEEFAGDLVYLTDGLFASPMFAYNGKRAAQIYNSKGKNATSDYIYDYTIADGVLYALTSDEHVVSTTDLKNWSQLPDIAPSGARSSGLLNDVLYVGGKGGDLWRYSDPLAAATMMSSELSMVAAVPEPSTLAMFLLGLLAVGCSRFTMMKAPWLSRHYGPGFASSH